MNKPPRPATSVAIRPAREGDLPEIAAIYADAVRHGTASYELEPPSLERHRRLSPSAGSIAACSARTACGCAGSGCKSATMPGSALESLYPERETIAEIIALPPGAGRISLERRLRLARFEHRARAEAKRLLRRG